MNPKKHRWEMSLTSLVKLLIFMVVILIGVVAVLEVQVQTRNHNIKQVKAATDKTQEAVDRIDTIVQEFKVAADGAPTIDPNLIIDALDSIGKNSHTLDEIKLDLHRLVDQLKASNP